MRLSGPVTGGTKGWAFGGSAADLTAAGYCQEEYFVEGDAVRYELLPGTEHDWSGRWQVEPADTAPYKTRMVVVRPMDPAAFNGTVIVLWNNVSAGYENFGGGDSAEFFEGGYAYAAVSAQRVGVHGTRDNPQGLRAWDPERYESLSIPSDDYSFDIFTQVASVVAPDRPRVGLDPLKGLEVRRLFAHGASQSAARLATYFNAVAPLTRRFHAFFLVMYFGAGTSLEVGDEVMTVQAASEGSGPRIPEGEHLLREDLEPPLMVLNTECEATSYYGVRQPDTDHFRYWEVAGASHVSLQAMASSAARMTRDFGVSIPLEEMQGINQVSLAPVVDAALHHLQAWVTEDIPPPVQPLIEFRGDPPEIVRDDNGIARGGIRLPHVEVPLAHNSAIRRGPDVFSRLVGSHELFPVEKVRELYGSRDNYLTNFAEAVRSAQEASIILTRDADPMLAEAAEQIPI